MASYVKRHVRKSQSERRQEIIETTLELLGEYGLEGTTVSRIAAAVGLTPGALYRHFESRAALIDAANKQASERSTDWLHTAYDPDVLCRLEALAASHHAWAKDNLSNMVRPFFLELAVAAKPELANQVTLARVRLLPLLVDLAEEGKRQGSIRADVDSADIAWAMLGHIWIEDIAFLLGGEQLVVEGAIARNLKRLLDSFRPDQPAADEG
ncbi:MAG TPA: TetR/AcrR family transcriptional regulator [Thermoleophilia bacterium]